MSHIVLFSLGRLVNLKGGMERVFCMMANELSRRGHRVTAICFDKPGGRPAFHLDPEVEYVQAGRSKPLRCYPPLRDLLCYDASRTVRHQKRGRQLMEWQASVLKPAVERVADADIFISYQSEATYILRECLKVQQPVITMFHLHPFLYTDRPVFEVLRPAVEGSDRLQVLMPEYVPDARSRVARVPIVHIPNVVPQHEERAALEGKTLICVARLSVEKNAELLVEAFDLLKDEFPDWKVEWWGNLDGRSGYVNRIKKMISDRKLGDRFELCGTTDDINSRLRAASVFAFPSHFEGFSLALSEAMAWGLPAVGNIKCPSVNTLIRDGENGFLTEPEPRAFAEALGRLMRDRELRLRFGARAQEDMRAYSPESVWGAWENLIRECLDERAERAKGARSGNAE